MSRQKPYRNRLPPELHETLELASNTSFFLLRESGPTSFVISNELGHKFKVTLGGTHSCSCGGGDREHCIHTLFTLLKIFRVPRDNPILWQLSFMDSDISFLLRQRHTPIIDARSTKKKPAKPTEVSRIKLEEEVCCAICQDGLEAGQKLIYCKYGCGHNFHVKCMKIWAEHRSSKHEDITCPLCRTDWGNNSLQELEKLNRQENSNFIHKGSVCMNCKESHSVQNPIRGTRYHCLMCKGIDLCETCYERVRHPHPFIMRKTTNSKWEPAIRHENMERMQGREISELDYDALRNLDNPPSLHEYYLSILSEARLGDICEFCDAVQPCRLRKLICGHSGHETCLIEAFREKRMYCPSDMLPVFLGLVSSHPQMIKLEPPKSRRGSHPLLSVNGITVGRSEKPVPHEELYRKITRNPRENLKKPRKLPSSASSNSREEMPAMLITRIQPERKSLFIANANNMLNH